MRLKNIANALLFSALLLALPAIASAAGHIAPTGETEGEASQLIVWYDETEVDDFDFDTYSVLQVTNGSTDTAVNIHVQIFADDSFDETDLCREHDFTDTLTPNDTVVYILGSLDSPFDGCPTCTRGGNNAHAPIPINIDQTRGFIVVTPVNQATLPRQAISHNHLFGSIFIFDAPDEEFALSTPAMGRLAVDFATGEPVADGILLDGLTTGFTLLQPSMLMTSFNDFAIPADDENNVVSIAFSDTYSDPNGEYRAVPGTAVWDPLMYDQFEIATSCQQHTQTCFVSIGLNSDWTSDITDVELCPSADVSAGFFDGGWVRIAVSGLSGLDNNLGLLGLGDTEGQQSAAASWMYGE